MKYKIRMEWIVEYIDFADVEIEATSKEEAVEKAIDEYLEGNLDLQFYTSEYIDINLDTLNSMHWLVKEIK